MVSRRVSCDLCGQEVAARGLHTHKRNKHSGQGQVAVAQSGEGGSASRGVQLMFNTMKSRALSAGLDAEWGLVVAAFQGRPVVPLAQQRLPMQVEPALSADELSGVILETMGIVAGHMGLAVQFKDILTATNLLVKLKNLEPS